MPTRKHDRAPLDANPDHPAVRLLVRGANWLGDAVMSIPALLRLREAFPRAHIALLTPAKLADLWLDHPAVDSVLRFEPGDTLWRVANSVRRGCFDLGLVLPNSPRSALELFLGRVPRRVGYAASWRRWFLTRPLPRRPGYLGMRKRTVAEIRALTDLAAPSPPGRPALPAAAHQTLDYLHLAAALGANGAPCAPSIPISQTELLSAGARFGVDPASAWWLGLNIGAEYGPAKRWPAERFAAAAAALQRRTGCHCLILGGPRDAAAAGALAEMLARSAGALVGSRMVVNAAGCTSLRELCALLKFCRVLLTNDTGPMHLSAAVGTPVVVPFGSTSPELTAPGLPGDAAHRLLRPEAACAPCFRRICPIDLRCLNSIGVDRVVAAVIDAATTGV
jgi:heptosyltransferase-2